MLAPPDSHKHKGAAGKLRSPPGLFRCFFLHKILSNSAVLSKDYNAKLLSD